MYEYIIREIVTRDNDFSPPHWDAKSSNSKSRKDGAARTKGKIPKIRKVGESKASSAEEEVTDKKVA